MRFTSLLVLLTVSANAPLAAVPDWVVYPGSEWEWALPQEAGLDVSAWESYRSAVAYADACGGSIHDDFPDGSKRFGACVQRGGYMLHCWGNNDYTYNSASVGKAFNGFLLQLAIDKGLVTGAEHITDVWPDCPSHCDTRTTLDNLFAMKGGFSVSNGYSDGCDNTKCVDTDRYSSGGMWRLMQALTYVFDADLKEVIDREIFSTIGIVADDWYWLKGKELYDNIAPPNAHPDQEHIYPDWTAQDKWYGCFVDAPYQVKGHWVRGGGGWVGMSPMDLCRIGLLLASDGYWDGEKIIAKTWRVTGHAGCGGAKSDLKATGGKQMWAWGKVMTGGITYPSSSLITGPITKQPTSTCRINARGRNRRFRVTSVGNGIRITMPGSERTDAATIAVHNLSGRTLHRFRSFEDGETAGSFATAGGVYFVVVVLDGVRQMSTVVSVR